MKSHEFLERNMRERNGMLVIGPIDELSQYCIECFKQNDELVKVEHIQNPYGWRCPKGHFSDGQKLATGGFA